MKIETLLWLVQRVTAVLLVTVLSFFIISMSFFDQRVHSVGSVLLSYPITILSMLSLSLLHGFLGMKVVMEDYISSTISRRILEIVLSLVSFTTFLVAIYLIFFVSFNGCI